MKRFLFFFQFVFLIFPVIGQTDSVWKKNLKEVVISDERLDVFNTCGRVDKPDSLVKHLYNSNSLASLLDASSGLVIRSYGPGILATSSLRGGNAQQTALSWNGLSINSPVNGLSDLNLTPSFLFDNATLLPGIAGSLLGSGAISGGINLTNSSINKDPFSLKILQSFSSFGGINSGLSLNYSKNKWVNATKVYFNSAHNNYTFINTSEANNPIERLGNANYKILSVLQETGYNSTKAGIIKISYWGTFANRAIPATMLQAQSSAKQEDQGHKVMLNWDYTFKHSIVKIRSLYQNDFLKYTDSSQSIRSVSKSEYLTNDADWRFKLIPNSYTSLGWVQTSTNANVNSFYNGTTVYRAQTAFRASHFQQITKIKTSITMNIRQEIVDLKVIPFIPAFGFRTMLPKGFICFGQAGRVFRLPTLNDLYWSPGGNPNLKPESGWTEELSLEFQKKKKRVEFTTTITGYNRTISNWIQWQPLNAQVWSPINIGKVNSRGLEWQGRLKVQLTKNINTKLGLNFDYTQSQNMDPQSKSYQKQLIYIPYFKSSGFINMAFKKTNFITQYVLTGMRYTTTDNLESIPAYGVVNIALRQEFKKSAQVGDLFIKINNVLNASYQAIIWRPMPGINYEVGINLTLK